MTTTSAHTQPQPPSPKKQQLTARCCVSSLINIHILRPVRGNVKDLHSRWRYTSRGVFSALRYPRISLSMSLCAVYLQSLIVMPTWQESVTLCVSSLHAGICYQRLCLSFLDAFVLLAHLNCVSNLSDQEETCSFPGDSDSWLESESLAPAVQEDETHGLWKQNSVLATCCRSQTTETEIEP